MNGEYMGELEFTYDVLKRAIEYLDEFRHCPKGSLPNIRLRLTSEGWDINHGVCTLKSPYNRGVVFDCCDACKIKKETGKYPGEDFNPLDMLSGEAKELIKFIHRQ